MKRRRIFCSLLSLLCLAALGHLFAVLAPGQTEGNHWGTEAGYGRAFIPVSLTEITQSRYSASLSGNAYTFGLVRFHGNGSPSFSLQFCRSTLSGKAVDLNSPYGRYEGSTAVSGFLATKHLNFVARRRFSIGLGLGGGIAPQLKANYTRTLTKNGASYSERKEYTLKDIPVTPLFEFQIRGDIRLTRNFSAGPWVGLRNGIPVAGGVMRVHFLK